MDEFKGAKTIQFINLLAQGAPMTLAIKGAQRLKVSNPPLIVLSNLTIEQVYHKTFEKNPELVRALQSRFLEIVLTEPLDLDNIAWPTDATSLPALPAEMESNVEIPMDVVTASVTTPQVL